MFGLPLSSRPPTAPDQSIWDSAPAESIEMIVHAYKQAHLAHERWAAMDEWNGKGLSRFARSAINDLRDEMQKRARESMAVFTRTAGPEVIEALIKRLSKEKE